MHQLRVLIAFASLLVPTGAAANDVLSGQERSRIEAVLQALNCRANAEMIAKQGDRYVLKDVFCEDGQFYIEINRDFVLVVKRAE